MKKETQTQPTALNHKQGDIVVIKNNYYGHLFKVGTKVRITSVGENDYRAKSLNGKSGWWVADANFIPNI